MSRFEEMTPRQRHRTRRLMMLLASLGLTAVLLVALSVLLNQRATVLGARDVVANAPTETAPRTESSAAQPAALLAQVATPTPTPTPTLALDPGQMTPTAQPLSESGQPLYPKIELTDLPLPAEDQVRIYVQLLIASPTPISISAAPGSTTLFMPLLSRSYGPPTFVLPAARDPEPFYSLDGLSTTNWPSASQMSASKLSVHAIGRGDPYIMQFVRSARPRLIKTVGDFGWLAEVDAIDPNTTIIGRAYGQDESWVLTVDPAQAASEYINRYLGEYRNNPFIDYWEGWNEFVWSPGEIDRLQWYVQFEASRACQMQALGLKAAVGGFAVGWPNTYPEYEHFLPMLEAANRCGAIFHLHEYNRPLMFCGVASNKPDIIPGAPPINQPAGPLTLRYRFLYEGWLRPRGLAQVPLVISETGIDRVPATGDCAAIDPYAYDPGHTTWKQHSEWWVQTGVGPTPELAYVNQLAWYDRELRHDSYVLGATVFTMGANGGTGGWADFDIHDAAITLANYVASQR